MQEIEKESAGFMRDASRRKLQAAQAREALALIPEPEEPEKYAKIVALAMEAVDLANEAARSAAAEVGAADEALQSAWAALAAVNERRISADANLEGAIQAQKMAEASRSQRATLIGIIDEASREADSRTIRAEAFSENTK